MKIQDGMSKAPDVNRFFLGWKKRPSQEVFEEVLNKSNIVVSAVDESGTVIGFGTALTDGVLSAYISLIEVVPEHQNQGVGTAIMNRLMEKIGDLYMIDTICDEPLVSFYEKFGMTRGVAMSKRNH